jgi:DNA invertase Pin-like site-specific DNA recombinase
MKTYGYCRVSTAEQADGQSLEAQKQQIAAWATIKGLEVSAFFVEEGVSGSVALAERPQGRLLMERARRGDVIIAPKLDRMFRNASDALATLEELKGDGIALHLIDLGGDVMGNGIGKLTFTILAAVAESERDRLRERIREVKRHMTSQGIFSGGKRPFGSDVVEDGKIKRLVPNREEQAIIARMQTLRGEGATLRDIGTVVGKGPKTVQRILERVGRPSV